MRKTVALLAFALLALAGCTSSGAPLASAAPTSAPPAAVVTATPTPTPTPADITAEVAGARYLELVEPTNTMATPWNVAVNAGDYATLRTMAPQMATNYRTFADGLVAADWPDSAQATVDALVGELATQIPIYLGLAASTTDDDTDGYLYQFAGATSAQELRILLGLGNVPVP